MRLLNVISTTDPAYGGPIEWVRQFGPIAEKLGHTIEVASMDTEDAPWVKDFPLTVYPQGQRFKNFYSPRLYSWLKTNARNYDAVIAHGLWRYPSYGTWRALHNTETPYFVYTHGMLDPWFKHQYPLKHFFKWLYWPWTDYRALRDARGVIFTCEQEKNKASESYRLYKASPLIATLGITPPPDNTEQQLQTFFERFPETRGKRLIVFLGRIHPKKGCDLLIEAFAKISPAENNMHLVMAGPGFENWIPELQRTAQHLGIEEHVTWTDMISGDLKWGAFRSADAFILPSHQENFGIAVVEAMSCSVPVLISNKVDIWNEIHKDNCGLIAEDTLESTTDILRKWAQKSPQDRTMLANNAKNSFQTRFDAEHATRLLMETLQASLDRKTSSR